MDADLLEVIRSKGVGEPLASHLAQVVQACAVVANPEQAVAAGLTALAEDSCPATDADPQTAAPSAGATMQVDTASTAGVDRTEAIDEAIYHALAYRESASPLEDDTDHDHDLFAAWDLITLTHTDPGGRRRYHPEPEATATEKQRMTHTATPPPDQHDDAGQAPDQEQGNQTGQAQGEQHEQRRRTARNPWDQPHNDPPPF